MGRITLNSCRDAINRVSTANSSPEAERLRLRSAIFQVPPPKTSTLANTQTGEPCPTQIA